LASVAKIYNQIVPPNPKCLKKKNVFDINIKEMEKHDIGETTYHTTEKSQKQIAQKLKEFLDV